LSEKLFIEDQDIVVICDGDDWYSKDYAFSYLNEVFKQKNIWLTYGGCIDYPSVSENWRLAIPDFIEKNNDFRSFSRNTSQQRAFYAWLFRSIKLQDFFYEGNFITTSSDVCKMYPMLEMAGKKHEQLKYPIYVYNRSESCPNDDKVYGKLQYDIDHDVRARKKYVPLQKYVKKEDTDRVALLLIDPNFQEMNQFISLLSSRIIGLEDIHIFLNENCKNCYKGGRYSVHYYKDLKKDLTKVLAEGNYSSILLTHQLFLPERTIRINEASLLLHKTKAFCFDLLLTSQKEQIVEEELFDDVCVWQNCVNHGLVNKNALEMQLYELKSFLSIISNFAFVDFDSLKKGWSRSDIVNEKYNVNLFYK